MQSPSNDVQEPFHAGSVCSNTFWEEDASGIPASDLFHFTADIKGSHVAITLDKGTRYNFVSIEVVAQLQLVPTKLKRPFIISTNDAALHINHTTSIPLTMHGHTERVFCNVLPRAFTCCHLLLSAKWCHSYNVNFVSHYPDLQFFWNKKKNWIIHARLKKIQEVRRQPLFLSHHFLEKQRLENIEMQRLEHIVMGFVEVKETCEAVSTNVTMSTPSVLSCDVQVDFEEREPIVQPAPLPHTLEEHTIVPSVVSCTMQVVSKEREPTQVQSTTPLEKDEPVPTKSEENAIDIGADLELHHANSKFFEHTNLLADSCDLHDIYIHDPCANFPISTFEHVVLITHKEVLAKIPPVDIAYSIMLNEPITVQCAMNTISAILYVNSSTFTSCFTLNLVGNYGMNEIFMVDHVCITCDTIAELKPVLPCLDCLLQFDRVQPDSTHMFCLPQQLLHTYAIDLYFTYICNLSCILHNGNNEHDNTFECNTIWSLHCSKFQSSAVETLFPIYTDLHCLDCFDLTTMKFDHRSSVRKLDLVLNNKKFYRVVSHLDHAYMNFTYICNCDCCLLRYYLSSYDNYVLDTCNFRCYLSCENTYPIHTKNAHSYIYIYL